MKNNTDRPQIWDIKFKCVHCGKIGAGRLPKGGDTSFYYPRRHKLNGKDCPGNIMEAKIITTETKPHDQQ